MAVLALLFGGVLGYFFRYFSAKRETQNAKISAQDVILKAKAQALKILEEAKKDVHLKEGGFKTKQRHE